jgi:hypothetical protein
MIDRRLTGSLADSYLANAVGDRYPCGENDVRIVDVSNEEPSKKKVLKTVRWSPTVVFADLGSEGPTGHSGGAEPDKHPLSKERDACTDVEREVNIRRSFEADDIWKAKFLADRSDDDDSEKTVIMDHEEVTGNGAETLRYASMVAHAVETLCSRNVELHNRLVCRSARATRTREMQFVQAALNEFELPSDRARRLREKAVARMNEDESWRMERLMFWCCEDQQMQIFQHLLEKEERLGPHEEGSRKSLQSVGLFSRGSSFFSSRSGSVGEFVWTWARVLSSATRSVAQIIH